MVSIIVAIIVFGIIIIVHEFGHFAAAKLNRVKVNEFAVGMGPKLLKKKKGETLYSLRLLPIGGFCAMEGEDAGSDDDGAFCKKSVPRKVVIVAAGAVMNLILGLVFLIVMTAMEPLYASNTVSWFEDGAQSQASGLMIGDKIIKVNGHRIFTDTDLAYELQSDSDGVFDMVVERNGEKNELSDIRFGITEVGEESGRQNLHIDFKVQPIERGFTTVVSQSFKRGFSYAKLVWVSLGDLITGQYKINDLSGPVGIVSTISDVVSSQTGDGGIDWHGLLSNLFSMAALISINVGIFNLLPLPALDGGRLVFLIIEGIRGKAIDPKKEGWVHAAGLILLLLLMAYVSINDIIKIFS